MWRNRIAIGFGDSKCYSRLLWIRRWLLPSYAVAPANKKIPDPIQDSQIE